MNGILRLAFERAPIAPPGWLLLLASIVYLAPFNPTMYYLPAVVEGPGLTNLFNA